MAWEEFEVEALLPTEKEYSIVKLDTLKPPDDEDAAVKMYEVDDLEEAVTPDGLGMDWLAYDRDGNAVDI